VLLLAACTVTADAQVVINEFSPSNDDLVLDEDGDSPDWIELFNTGNTPVNLEGWAISDDSLKRAKWIFPPVTISPKEYLLVFASAKDRKEGTYLHTDFKLERGEEPLILSDASGNIIDSYQCICVADGCSYGHFTDGSGSKFHLATPTPGSSNNASGVLQHEDIRDSIVFSHAGGFYTGAFDLGLSVSNQGVQVRYTLDGSVPSESSAIYQAPVQVRNMSAVQGLAYIPTSPEWKKPQGNVFRGMVVRAAAYANGCRVSPVYTKTYLIDPAGANRYGFPIVSLTADYEDIFSESKGIYVPGHYGTGAENYFNKGEAWERDVHMELYSTDGSLAFEQDLAIRIHGRGTRERPQKSLRLYAKAKYGDSTMSYPFFKGKEISSFRRIILKTTNTHESTTLFKDELCAEVISRMNLDYQAYHPVIVLINGEYWGVHNMRERQDKYYIASNHNVSPDSLDMLGLSLDGSEEIEGDAMSYNDLLFFIASHDMSDDNNYREVEKRIDITNYIDVHIAHLYFANYDWPRNNVRYWRERAAESRWRWMFFDCDFCMNNIYHNQLASYVDGEPRFEESTWLVRQLMNNQGFRKLFMERFMHHLNTTFEPQRMITLIREFRDSYGPMVNEHIARWGVPESYAEWESNVSDLENFALKRTLEMVDQLVRLYGHPFTVYPNPASSEVYIDMFGDDSIGLEVKLFNLHGQQLGSRSFGSASGLEAQPIDISGLSPGLYLVQVRYGHLIFNDKLVVK
jgi:hypothetical protein